VIFGKAARSAIVPYLSLFVRAYLDDGGHLEIDRATGRLYDPDVEAARRAAAWKYIQRYGAPRAARSPH
jgi:hypothetical protein